VSHDYAISAGGVALSTITSWSRLVKWTAGQKRGTNFTLPYMHGEVASLDKYFTGADVLLEVGLPGEDDDDASEALSDVQAIFASQGLVTVQYNDPYKGNIRALTELLTEPVPSQGRLAYLFALRNPGGFWEDATANTASAATPPVVTTGGDRPIQDMVLTFSGPGYLEHTDSLGQVARLTIDAGAGAGTYVVDVGAGTVTKSAVAQDEFLTATQPWWMKFSPAASQSLTASVSVAVSWRNKWA
jgi:hypothetical protein